MNKRLTAILLATPLLHLGQLQAQTALSDAFDEPRYEVEMGATLNNGATPLWQSANRYGVGGTQGKNAWVRAAVGRPAEADSIYKWRVGYGLDIVGGVNLSRQWSGWIQQAFMDFDYQKVRISVGAKERPMEMKNQELSSGSQTFGINARPIPQVRFELPDYVPLNSRHPWVSIKGHFGYGMMFDSHWQKYYLLDGRHYSEHVLYHSKAGYLKLGDEQRFPLTLEGGLEMATQFGAKTYNSSDIPGYTTEMGHGAKDFLKAIYAGGSDATDGDYANASGNTVGSWVFNLKYTGKQWSVRTYYDHFFEDHSQMFFQYGWLDGLLGVEVELPKNRIVSRIVYEWMRTDYQSGPIYHDQTAAMPDQISAADNYYNHTLTQGWQYFGQAIGNPFFTSPLYKNDGTLDFTANRFKAHHVGLSGDPSEELHYRLLFSHLTCWGNYNVPYEDGAHHNNSLLVEATYKPTKLTGWAFTASFGFDHGILLGNNYGAQFKVAKLF